MSSKYYYYPVTSNGRTRVDRDRRYDRDYDQYTSTRGRGGRPETPPLSRGSTPESSAPSTPRQYPIYLDVPKAGKRHVEFASPVAEASRRAEWDELSVMRAFASHASHCDSCRDPVQARSSRGTLCDRGAGLAKDIGTYFYCYDGKPYSMVERTQGRPRTQIEVPNEYGAVKRLFEALDGGLKLKKQPTKGRPEVHYPTNSYATPRPSLSRRHTLDSMPTSNRRTLDDQMYELRPSRSDSRRKKDTTYRGYGDRQFETRTPYDEVYASRNPSSTTPRTFNLPTKEYASSRRRDDNSYYDRRRDDRYYSPPRDSKRSSTYPENRSKRDSSSYYFPSLSRFWR